YLVVLAIRIVVAALGAAELVAGHDHRRALRQEQSRQEIAPLATAQRVDALVVGGALDAEAHRVLVIAAVAVGLAVGLVVLVLVRNEMVEREPVVGGDEVDAGGRAAAARLVEVAAAGEAIADFAGFAAVAAPQSAHGVAVATVPLGPANREIADLVTAF